MPTEAGRHEPGAFGRSGWVRKALRFSFSLLFFPFLPEGSGASWARDKRQPAVGSSRPSCPEERHGKVPATYLGSGFPAGVGRWRCPGCVPSGTGTAAVGSCGPHPTCHSLSRSILKHPSPSWPLASRREREMLISAVPACAPPPSCWAEPVPPGHPSRMSSYPSTSRTRPSCIHPTNICGASLGTKLQVMPLCRA